MMPPDVGRPGQRSRQPNAFHIGAATLLLWILFAQAITSIPRLSITFDEDVHIAAGYSVWRTGDWRMNREHPPLIRLWLSWPLLISPDVPDPQTVPGWTEGVYDTFAHDRAWRSLPADAWVVPSRITITWLAVLLGAVLFRWAVDWFGPRAGLLALLLLTFDPNILANAPLATQDVGVTCFIFLAMYTLQRCLFKRGRRNDWIGAGIALGLALTSKNSALILVPIGAGLILLQALRLRRKSLFISLPLYGGAAFLVWWAVYGFELGRLSGLGVPVPAPTYWRSLPLQGGHILTGGWAFMLGETYQGARWYSVPVAFFLKTPLPVLILTGIAIWATVKQLGQRPRLIWREIALASLPVIFFTVSIFNTVNVRYRYLLPIVPFIYLAIARLFVGPPSEEQTWRGTLQRFFRYNKLKLSAITLTGLVLWQVAGTLLVWPFHLTFFNEIAGGPRNGYRYLADSDVDWGQALKAVRAYLEARQLTEVRLSSYTPFIRPEQYGIRATPLPPLPRAPQVLPARFDPAPGTYVISASTLRGLMVADRDMYNWFWHREPDDLIANAVLVYHVPQRPAGKWIAQCATPEAPLEPEAIAEGFGRDDLRLVDFDCRASWVYPGDSPGWYVIGEGIQPITLPQPLTLEFRAGKLSRGARFTIYRQEIGPSLAGLSTQVSVMPGQALDQRLTFDAPVQVGPLSFLGFKLDRSLVKPGQTVILTTYWRVTQQTDRLTSLMAHLVSSHEADRVIANGDGLGVPIEFWQPGDVIEQHHELTVPRDTPPGTYQVMTGVYTLEDLQRLKVESEGIVSGDRLVLGVVEVKP